MKKLQVILITIGFIALCALMVLVLAVPEMMSERSYDKIGLRLAAGGALLSTITFLIYFAHAVWYTDHEAKFLTIILSVLFTLGSLVALAGILIIAEPRLWDPITIIASSIVVLICCVCAALGLGVLVETIQS